MRQTLIVAAAIVGGLIGGFLLGISMASHVPLEAEESVKWHWKRVNDYRAFMRDPQNLHGTSMSGINAMTPPYDIEPSLLALKSAGEIERIDLVLPNVPNETKANRFWLRFCDEHEDEILDAHGNPSYTDYKPSGNQPLHLILWFKKSAKADIQKLIDELEALAAQEAAKSGHSDSPK